MAEKELSDYDELSAIDADTTLVALKDGVNAQVAEGVLSGYVDGRISASGLKEEIDNLIAGQFSDAIYIGTWSQLQSVAGTFIGQGAFVTTDTGTHTDPVSGITVSNSGQYSWTGSAWQWLREDLLALKADQSAVDAIEEEMPQKADREPLVERMYESDTDNLLPILGFTDASGNVRAPLQYSVSQRKLLSGTEELLTPSAAGDYADGLSVADADDLLPILGVKDTAGSAQVAVGYRVSTGVLEVNGVAIGSEESMPSVAASATIDGLSITISGAISMPSGNVAIDGEITITPESAVGATASGYSMAVSTDTRWWQSSSNKLPYRAIQNVSVTEDGNPLTEGTDYAVWYIGGRLRGISGSGTRTVDVTYEGLPQRYDWIVVNPMTGVLSLVEGTADAIDPQEHRTAVTSGMLPLFSVLSYGDTIEVIPVTEWDGTIKRNRMLSELQAHNRYALKTVRAALAAGKDLTIIGYGDSITALAGLADHTVANGAARDLRDFFNLMSATVYAGIPALDFGDGGGSIHTDLGWNLQLAAWIESAYGITVEYLNYGIGGSTSGTGSNDDRLNGLNTTRLDYVTAAASAATSPVLVNLAFGMNELGSTSTLANIVELAQTFQDLGATVQIIGVPRPNDYGGFITDFTSWRYTNDALWMAARATGAAFVPLDRYLSDDDLGYMGLHPMHLSAANCINHPGPSEFNALSKIIISNFEG